MMGNALSSTTIAHAHLLELFPLKHDSICSNSAELKKIHKTAIAKSATLIQHIMEMHRCGNMFPLAGWLTAEN